MPPDTEGKDGQGCSLNQPHLPSQQAWLLACFAAGGGQSLNDNTQTQDRAGQGNTNSGT